VEHHFHFGIEHAMWITVVAVIGRYLWKLFAALLAGNDGAIGQLGVALGGIAQ
jgi:hypothetical protein